MPCLWNLELCSHLQDVTKSGTKYHRDGCRYLAKSQIPIALADTAGRYGPCSVCSPPQALGATTASPTPPSPGQGATPTPQANTSQIDPNQTVYATKTGTKYHRAGCRYLSKSQIPFTLKDASARYGPCSVCTPPTLSSGAGVKPAPAPPTPVAAGRCQATTQKGTRCKRSAAAGSSYCWQHGG